MRIRRQNWKIEFLHFFGQEKPFDELFTKITIKVSKIISFSRNAVKREMLCSRYVAATTKFCRELPRIAREERRLDASKSPFVSKKGNQITTQKYKNIARQCIFSCRFESPKNPIFSTLGNSWKWGNFTGKNLVVVHWNLW